ncbi:MAG: hypothetical protein IPI49_29540 [Myxococcales bacterium]|nr:hypothetical protein [Myxococcales bacterium]
MQQLLDRCVARPAALRRLARLEVMFAPPQTSAGLATQQLAPVAVTLPGEDLQRLWQDTDPHELQACLDQVRMLALSVSVPDRGTVQVLAAQLETLSIQL